jgi:hypothetical protein
VTTTPNMNVNSNLDDIANVIQEQQLKRNSIKLLQHSERQEVTSINPSLREFMEFEHKAKENPVREENKLLKQKLKEIIGVLE